MKTILIALLWVLASMPLLAADPESAAGTDGLRASLEAMAKASFSEKSALIAGIAGSGDDRARVILEALLDGNLQYRKEDLRPVYLDENEEGDFLVDALTGENLGAISSKRKVKKITINNQLRGELKLAIAGFKLSQADAGARAEAARSIINGPEPELLPLVADAIDVETEPDVRELLGYARASIIVANRIGDADQLIAALSLLGEATDRNVISLVSRFLLKDEEGNYLEKDPRLVEVAEASLNELKAKQSFYQILQNVFFGVSLGSVLLLTAVGLAITFGVMGVINMAHGEMIMIGAYTTYTVQLLMPNLIGASILVAVPMAFLASGAMGILIERLVIRHLYGRPLETLLATFGISLILQQLVRSIYSPLNRSVITPDWMSGSLAINGMFSLTYNRLYIVIFSLLVLLALMLLLKKTHFGLQMRAVTLNRSMASSMGIRTGWIDALTFGLGSGIAGVAGVALSQLTNVGPNLGQAYIIDSFMVVVFGGVGNLFGTLFAAMSLGIANKFAEPFAGAVLAKILILVFIILFIQKYPRGLFAIKGRFVED